MIAEAARRAIATTVRLLPETIDVSIILTSSSLVALAFTLIGVSRGYPADRVARMALGGTVFGATLGVVALLIAIGEALL